MKKIPEHLKKKLKILSKEVLECIAEQCIADGRVRVKRASKRNIREQIIEAVKDMLKRRSLRIIIDHSPSILNQDNKFAQSREYKNACLFFAMWFEHWFNGLIANIAERGLLTHNEVKVLIREMSLRAKCTVLPPLIRMPRIKKFHIDTINRIAELRNAYVHYKYQIYIADKEQPQPIITVHDIRKARRTVKYLQQYQNKFIYLGYKGKIIDLMKQESVQQGVGGDDVSARRGTSSPRGSFAPQH